MTEPIAAAHPNAKDLSREDPRPMNATVANHPWLPRIIDKARAAHAGRLGSYYRYPCPIDAACLDLLGIDADAFQDIACRVVSDHDVVDELAHAGADLQRLAAFDPIRLNADLHKTDR